MEAFELADLVAARAASGRLYHEFLRTHDLSVGLYQLAAGAEDPQGPHTEDEVYYVVSGRAAMSVGREERTVATGSVVFVPADVVHRFHDIAEDLVLLVFFGPAEYTHRVRAPGASPPRSGAGLRRGNAADPWRPSADRERLAQPVGELRASACVVVAEKHVRIQAVVQERRDPGRPRP